MKHYSFLPIVLICWIVPGYSYSRTFQIITDTIAPTVICPPSDTVQLAPGACLEPYFYTVDAFDDGPDFSLGQIAGLASGKKFPIGTTVNTFEVTDPSGNSATCSFSVTVLPDSSAIILVCKDSVILNLDPDCTSIINADVLLDTSVSIVCPSSTTVRLDRSAPFNDGPWGFNTVVTSDINKSFGYRVEDALTGNVCYGKITILPPLGGIKLVCKDTLKLDLPNGCITSLSSGTGASLAVDFSKSNGLCGASFSCRSDETLPFDNGPWEIPLFTSSDLGKVYGLWVTESSSNLSCYSRVVIRDTNTVTLQCPTIVLPCGIGHSNAMPQILSSNNVPDSYPTPTGSCYQSFPQKDFSYVDSLTSFPCDSASDLTNLITRKWSVTYADQKKASCVQRIEMRRRFNELHVPDDRKINCNGGQITFPPTPSGWPYFLLGNKRIIPSIYTNCGITFSYTDSLANNNCHRLPNIHRIWSYTYTCGQIVLSGRIGIETIRINDKTAPKLTCPADTVVSIFASQCKVNIVLPPVMGNDALCSEIGEINAYWNTSDSAVGQLEILPGNNPVAEVKAKFLPIQNFEVGKTEITYRATDLCGNVKTCRTVINVLDQDPPVAKCKDSLTVALDTSGTFMLNAETLDDGSIDYCTPIHFRLRRAAPGTCGPDTAFTSQVMFCCADRGDTIGVVLRVYDMDVPGPVVEENFGQLQYSQCTTQVVVSPAAPQACRAKKITVLCNELDPSLKAYDYLLESSCFTDSTTVSNDFSALDTICKTGLVLRNFTVFDETGTSGSCTQQVNVVGNHQYFIRFPDDKIVQTFNPLQDFGKPIVSNLICEDLKMTYTDSIVWGVTDACYHIQRLWKIENACAYDPADSLTYVPNPNPNNSPNHSYNLIGPQVSKANTPSPWTPTSVRIKPSDGIDTNFSKFYKPNSNGYLYKQLIKVATYYCFLQLNAGDAWATVTDSTANSPELWKNTGNILYGTTGCEAPADLSCRLIDSCSFQDVSLKYQLHLDLNGDGTQETIVLSDNTDSGTVTVNGMPLLFDSRPVPADQLYRFTIEIKQDSVGKTGYIRWTTAADPNTYITPELPYGTHYVRWISTGACNNKATEQLITIKDGRAPKLHCKPLQTVNLLPNGLTPALAASSFIVDVQGNCSGLLNEVSIRKLGQGEDFPYLPGTSIPVSAIQFGCLEVGLQEVEIWGRDFSGNLDTCQVKIEVTDNQNHCLTAGSDLQVCVESETGAPVGLFELYGKYSTINGPLNPFTFISQDSNGCNTFYISIPLNTQFVIAPKRLDNPLNGVSTFDLALISRHVLGLELLDSPYKILAADINRSNTITSFDIVELRKLILGIYNKLPENDSWRFVPKNFIFPNLENPFAFPVPDSLALVNEPNLPTQFFYGIKIGDVNNNAIPFQSGGVSSRQSDTLFLTTGNVKFQAGEIVEIPFQCLTPTLGYQFTLETGGMEILSVEPEKGIKNECFGVFEDKLTVSYFNEAMPTTSFRLKCRAPFSGETRQFFKISDKITRSEGYVPALGDDPLHIALEFGKLPTKGDKAMPVLLQNRPNPFSEATVVPFYLPEKTQAVFSVFDVNGRQILSNEAVYSEGWHEFTIDHRELPGKGVYWYQLQTHFGQMTKKMLVF